MIKFNEQIPENALFTLCKCRRITRSLCIFEALFYKHIQTKFRILEFTESNFNFLVNRVILLSDNRNF